MDKSPFEGWAILELMGHRRLAGLVREQEIAGKGFLRIDVPEGESWAASQFYSPDAVYCLTPTTEEIARAIAAHARPEPAHRWELPAPARPSSGVEIDPDDPDDEEEERLEDEVDF